jgi:N6-L-threonylcarbamoyladenine synthase
MKILAIETSCDETALALVEVHIEQDSIKAHTIQSELFSQIDIHKEFGGVFPAVAKREHAKWLPILLQKILKPTTQIHGEVPDEIMVEIEQILSREIGLFEDFKKMVLTLDKPDIDIITVTQGPGLEPALWVGISFARALSLYWNIPLIGANHMKGHIFSVLLNKQHIEFPALSLLISGGHTELVHMNSIHEFTILGQTKDDAVGESYDKVARMLGFEYPGGPKIAELAEYARQTNIGSGDIVLPRPMIHTPDFDFSFSGLKTAVLYKIKELGELNENLKINIAHEFEEAIVDVLIKKMKKVIEQSSHPYKTIIVSGGVIANSYIRSQIQKLADHYSIPLLLPLFSDSTDNAQMIAVAGAIQHIQTPAQINPPIKASGSATY